MKLIKPKQISGEIMTLLDEADEKVIIVSPYAQTKDWTKLQNTFEDLKARNIPVEFYFRQGEKKTESEINNIGVKGIPIENLHCKIYMNEKVAVVASMNLYMYSDDNSLDIAYKTESKKEYRELYKFYERYLRDVKDSVFLTKNHISDLMDNLKSKVDKSFRFSFDGYEIEINYGGSNYCVNIESNELEIVGILTQKQFKFAAQRSEILKNKKIKYELIKGENGEYDQVCSWSEMKSKNIKKLYKSDSDKLIDILAEFIKTVDSIKIQELSNRANKV